MASGSVLSKGHLLVSETAGEVFADGVVVELVCQPGTDKLALICWNEKTMEIANRVEHRGRYFVPVDVATSMLEVLRVPSQNAPYRSASSLISSITTLLEQYGVPAGSARLLAYFVISTWFVAVLPWVPSLLLHGPAVDIVQLLRLLACLCRRAVVLTGVSPSALYHLPLNLRPTLMIAQPDLRPAMQQMLGMSSFPGLRVPHTGKLLELGCPKVIYTDNSNLDPVLEENSLSLAIPPSYDSIRALNAKAEHSIVETFQPQLLDYFRSPAQSLLRRPAPSRAALLAVLRKTPTFKPPSCPCWILRSRRFAWNGRATCVRW